MAADVFISEEVEGADTARGVAGGAVAEDDGGDVAGEGEGGGGCGGRGGAGREQDEDADGSLREGSHGNVG